MCHLNVSEVEFWIRSYFFYSPINSFSLSLNEVAWPSNRSSSAITAADSANVTKVSRVRLRNGVVVTKSFDDKAELNNQYLKKLKIIQIILVLVAFFSESQDVRIMFLFSINRI